MSRLYRGDRKTCTVSNGGSPVSAIATAFNVSAGAATDFPGPGTATFEVQSTGESIVVTAGLGTTSWSSITRGANQTTAAVIPDGSVLLEINGANDYTNFQQKDDSGLGTSLLASTTPIVDGVGAVGTSAKAARADHVHPTSGGGAGDATTSSVGSVEVDHAPSGAHPIALTTDGLALPSTMLGATTPLADGTGAAGTAVQASRSDHVHPLPLPPVVAKVANYTILAADNQTTFLANAAALVFTLPAPATAGSGFAVEIKNKNQTATSIKTNTAGVLLDGVDCSAVAFTTGLTTAWGHVRLVTDGTAWFTV